MNGTIVGSYRIVDTLSVGGMGAVYRAEHTLLGRVAAVKLLHPELCANRDIVNRFFNEAKVTTSIKHPGIVEVFDFGYMPSGHAYLIMEFLEGMPLSHRVRVRGPISEGEAALLLRSVCIALSAAHDKGVVHRDLKPDNVFMVPDPESVLGERTKILDFGIAKLTDTGSAGAATRTGAVMGTPTYMSPEQCRGTGDVDFRADLYSIGCMFYELVTGRPPFVNPGAGELIGSHLFVEPEPPSRHIAGLSPDTEALIMRLLAKQPERRVQTAKELAQRLTGIAQQHGWMPVGDPSWSSLSHVAVVAPPASARSTPVFTPAAAPAGIAASSRSTLPSATQPTTLSGTASVVTASPRRSRRGIGLAIAGALLAATGAVAVIVRSSSPTPASDAVQPAAAHAATPPAPPAMPAATPPPEPATAPPAMPAATPPSDAAPTGDPTPPSDVTTLPPSVAPPAVSPPNPRSHAADKPTLAPADHRGVAVPVPPGGASAEPKASAQAPATTRPASKPSGKPGKGSANGRTDLLEQDI